MGKLLLKKRFGFELWEGHIKQVEGHCGTAVASYFVLLRWLFYMNMAILSVWTLFVLIPQFVVEPSLHKQYFPCIHRNDSRNCTHNTTVHLVIGNCTTPPARGLTVATLCSDPMVKVMTTPTAAKNSSTCLLGPEEWYQCPARKPSFSSLIDLITGRGGYNDTVLFLGHYSSLNEYNGIPYNRPVAILVCTAVVYCISFIMLIIRLVQTGRQVYVRKASKTNFCGIVFGSWDFGVINTRAIVLHKKCIQRDLEEELALHLSLSNHRTLREILQVILIRIVTNGIVILLLVGSGAAIIEATIYSWKQVFQLVICYFSFLLVLLSTSSKGLLVPILVIFFIIALPIVFHIIGSFERYKSQSGHAKMTLIRSAIVRITTLVIYIVAAYAAIQCTQPSDMQVAQFNVTLSHNRTVCHECWETFVGQQFYQLLLLEFLFIALFTVVLETVRNLAHKIFYKKVQKKVLKAIFSKPSFILPDSILDLVYFQLLLWLGFFFTPLQPLFLVIILVVMFYVKKCSVMWNLGPEDDLFRGSTVMFLSIVLLFSVYIFAVSLVGYAVIGLVPSAECGPFQNKSSILSVLSA
eukprot:Em0017g414a